MVIVRRTVIGADEKKFSAFVNDGTVEPGDELYSGTFRRTDNWVNVRCSGRSISTMVFEQVGDLTLVGFHQESIGPDAEQVAHEPVVQQLII